VPLCAADLDSEVEKERTAKQKVEEEKQKREEELVAKKKQHMQTIESLVNDLQVSSDEITVVGGSFHHPAIF